MKKVVIFIPGTMGSKLYDDEGRVGLAKPGSW